MLKIKEVMSGKELFQNKYRVQSSRLVGWNYACNANYFVTIVTRDRMCYFGDIVDKKMVLSNIGIVADLYAHEIPFHSLHVRIEGLVVMPNHVHIIIAIDHPDVQGVGDCVQCIAIQNLKKEQFDQNYSFYKDQNNNHCRDEAMPRLYSDYYSDPASINKKSNSNNRNTNGIISPHAGSLSTIIGSYKSACTKYIHQALDVTQFAWQERFYDHIIRDELELQKLTRYIEENPKKWNEDKFYFKYRNYAV